MESNVRKAGISMVALVITIIVLIVLTSAVVITGVGAPKQAQLAVFYNNIDTVQDLVSLTMGDNMITATLEGKEDNYKWVNIVEGCNTENWSTSGVVTFGPIVTGLDKNVARISPALLGKTSLPTTEIDKYYVDNNGVVYYEGFVYEGQTMYTKGAIIGENNTQEVVTNPIDGSFNADKGVNSPKLLPGMTAVYWDTNGNEVTSTNPGADAEFYNNWYNYIEQTTTTENGGTSHWANAKTSDGSYWVWIPRYAYSITSGYHGEDLTYITNSNGYLVTEQAGTIKVEFLKNKTNVSTTGRMEYQNATGENNWNVHPAFYYDNNSTTGGTSTTGTQLAGIWVAKYEMSGETSGVSSTPGNVTTTETIKAVSKPGVTSWRNINRSNIFLNALNYDTNSLNNANLDSHLMKDCECGAIAYLAHSKYGRNGTEITRNQNSGYYTGGDQNATVHSNVLQSTTGNCYGVYDMSGGGWEQVAAYLEGTSDTNQYGAELVKAEAKYKNVYDASLVTEGSTTTDYAKIGGEYVYGNSMYETSLGAMITISDEYNSSWVNRNSSWFSGRSEFMALSWPFLEYGGQYNSGSDISIFCFGCNTGSTNSSSRSWRVVLWGTN